jgi:hypothetical protein
MGAGWKHSGTHLFYRLCVAPRQRTREPRRDMLRHELRRNEQRCCLNGLRCGTFYAGDGWNRRPQARLARHQEIQGVVVLLLGVGLTMRRRTEFAILLQLPQDAELFAAMKALHAVSFIGGNGELEE